MILLIDQFSQQLHQRLKAPLPGEQAQQKTKVITPADVTFPYSIETAIPAAVLILLFPQDKDFHFFLTERTNEVEHHKGQISLPGGVWEEGEQLQETAIRETEEEIGVEKSSINFIGGLTPFFTPVTGFIIHPFVGWSKEKPVTSIQNNEVHELFTASISDLINENTLIIENWTISGYDAKVPLYNFGGRKVWGATAAILSEFKSILEELMN
ncbi:MAG: CoA pyrophosphatase [Candidatus Marinimicrobia bacterium]|nr:CoA pyrophosphatase [Candidatus Neomarinimicrobiota bacterium]